MPKEYKEYNKVNFSNKGTSILFISLGITPSPFKGRG